MNNKVTTFNPFFFLLNSKQTFLFIILKKKKNLIKINRYICINNYFKDIDFLNKKYLNNLILSYFFFSWKKFLVDKLKLRHKISWLKFFRKKFYFIKLNYGFSYNVYFNLNKIFLKKKKKYLTHNILFFLGLNLNFNFFQLSFIKNIQSLNQYSLRGYRFSKQKFIKRVGKISKYTEFKSKIL